jgi:hypothetical protein
MYFIVSAGCEYEWGAKKQNTINTVRIAERTVNELFFLITFCRME